MSKGDMQEWRKEIKEKKADLFGSVKTKLWGLNVS